MIDIFDVDIDWCDASVDIEDMLEDLACEIVDSYLLISDDCTIDDLCEAMAWRAGGFLLHEELFDTKNQSYRLFNAVESLEADHAHAGIKLDDVSHRKYLCDEDVCDGADPSCGGWSRCEPCVKCLHPYNVIFTWVMLVSDRGGVDRPYYLRVGIQYDDWCGLELVECWEDKNWSGCIDALSSKISSALGEIKIANALRGG